MYVKIHPPPRLSRLQSNLRMLLFSVAVLFLWQLLTLLFTLAAAAHPTTPAPAALHEATQPPSFATSTATQFAPPLSTGFRPALVYITSSDSKRHSERARVLASLCSGSNAHLISLHRFSLYLSVDGLTPVSLQSPCVFAEEWRHPRLDHPDAALRIADHYRFLLHKVFDEKKHTHALLLEDDLLPAADFVSLFTPPSPALRALEADPSVWCISAWNDVGVKPFASDPNVLFRSTIFPGLGWMLSFQLWDSFLRAHWPQRPTTGWDNWLRANNVDGRTCIVPEVCRVKHISKSGSTVTDGSAYERLAFQGSDPRPGDFELPGGDSLLDYRAQLAAALDEAPRRVVFSPSVPFTNIDSPLIVYYSRSELRAVYQAIGARPPIDGEPRSAFEGVITLRHPTTRHPMWLVDKLAAPFSPSHLDADDFVWKAGAPGQDCRAACHPLACAEQAMQATPIGKQCLLLKKLFPCEDGCGHQVGLEIPAYSYAADTKGQCLVTESASPLCHASHRSTARACACAKVE